MTSTHTSVQRAPEKQPAASSGHRQGSLRVLLSEGASTSAREAITALGLRGHTVEICDPDPHCLGRFSRFVSRFHRCPGMGSDPEGYFAFVLDLVASGRYDILLPIHEQGFLLAKVQAQLAPHVAVALPSFESYARAHSKAGFFDVLKELDLPQPDTRIVSGPHELLAIDRFPFVLKMAIGTASRGTWIVRSKTECEQAVRELEQYDAFDDIVLVQEVVPGEVEHAQAVFCDGRLVAMHANCEVARGAGGGPAVKDSIARPIIRSHLTRIGERLAWHGALSVDYIVHAQSGDPSYIDCNPRLVEPINALFAGLDLTEILLRVSLGEAPAASPDSRAGIRSHIAMQALLGCAARTESRRELLSECTRMMTGSGIYAGSREELTPVRSDWLSAVPLAVTALWLMATPKAAHTLPKKGWGSNLLNPKAARTIRGTDFATNR